MERRQRITCDVSSKTLFAIEQELKRRGWGGPSGRSRVLKEGIEMLLRASAIAGQGSSESALSFFGDTQPLNRFLEQAEREIVLVGITLPLLGESAIQELLKDKVKAGVNVTVLIVGKSLLEPYGRISEGIATKEWDLVCATVLDLTKVSQRREDQVRLLKITYPPSLELVSIDPFSSACQVMVSLYSDANYPTKPKPLFQVSSATRAGQLVCQEYLRYYADLGMNRNE